MRQLLHTILNHLHGGTDLVLVTVTASSGATPRGAGARMVVGANGRLRGTIGGGAIEYRAEQMALDVLAGGGSRDQTFSLTQDDIRSLGMVCGGEARVFLQHLSAGDTDTITLLEEALTQLSAGRDLWLLSDLSEHGRFSLHTKDSAPDWLLPRLTRQPQLFEHNARNWFLEQIGVAGSVYLFGGGHVARELEPVLTHLGFRCIVIDDRPEFAARELFPTAEQVLCAGFEHLDDVVSVGTSDYVCIMTRGHAHDTLVAAQLLSKKPRYIGMIGSRRKHAAVCQALRETYGYSDAEIAAIVSPIGLPIAAETPAEIAISIAAQMIAARAAQ